jgi:hypothetical protein
METQQSIVEATTPSSPAVVVLEAKTVPEPKATAETQLNQTDYIQSTQER